MNKKDILILAKKSKKREGAYYTTLYIDRKAVYDKNPFHVCKDFSFNEYNNLITSEDFDYTSLTTALISFYYAELEEFGIDKNVLSTFYNGLYNLRENFDKWKLSEIDKKLLEDNKEEIALIERLVNKWYSEDIK